uniref:Sepiapterin reductase n=1 Tax=Callorhinchus milii TaxID=7868 RepID=V9L1D5_CALMI|eukprot:gi/632979945/ref/XP_007906754.1/ PREDICTED: sepiapterin reductase [Callorhinchus milii]
MAERETVFRECLCVITGASRGLGKELALQLAPSLTGASSLVLVARSGERLEEVRRAVLASQPSLRVLLVPADLSTGQGVGAALAALPQHRPRRLLLLNNAGSLGDVSKFVVDFTSPAEITDYFSLNVTSFMCLSAGVLRAFPQKAGLTRTVVNISSLCAIKPFKSWSLYCMGKAAREMMCHVLAAEQPDLRVLSYAPGPLDTDMFLQARTETGDPEVREAAKSLYAEGNVLTPQDSARKLVDILVRDQFESGAHVDFYDK